MARTRNQALADWMTERAMSETELADQLNRHVATLTGRPGTTTGRTVRRWLSGEVTWPQARQREALARLTGIPAGGLGFVHRGAAPAAPVASQGPTHHVGMSDVARLTAKMADLVAADHRDGGTVAVESRAADLARQTLDLQRLGTASTRVRGKLYALAATLACSALWAASDGHRLDAAQQHLHQSVILAGLSADPSVQFRVWGHAAVLYRQLGRPTDALAAADVGRRLSVNRRDPLYASLAHVHTAVHHGDLGDRTAALRGIGHAQDALDRADPRLPRPPWMLFYDQSQLELLTVIAKAALGQWADAEAHAHRALALMQQRPGLVRERHRALVHLARTQLEQDALAPAVTHARAVPPNAWHGRTAHLLRAFTTRLNTLAPDAPETRAWTEYVREVRATPLTTAPRPH
ncbi:Tat pathway signal protein [Streptomyces syringium]|uniref:Tat pathway signal protein n=1 Tax=Streptomyces syringium TaxID=76729 RepID=UPI0034515BC9